MEQKNNSTTLYIKLSQKIKCKFIDDKTSKKKFSKSNYWIF